MSCLEFLNSDSDIPTDDIFEIVELPKHAGLAAGEQKVVIGSIKAHKYYLSTISKVFKHQFFNEASIFDNLLVTLM